MFFFRQCKRLLLTCLYATYRFIPIPDNLRCLAKNTLFTCCGKWFSHHPTYILWLETRKSSILMVEDSLPIAPSFSAFKSLTPVSQPQKAKIDVIIPVYSGYDETLNTIYHVLLAKNTTPFELIIINDASPDKALVNMLKSLAKLDLFTYYANAKNCGFVKTVNRGMQLHTKRDVILLNADTEVYNGWLDRIFTASQNDPNIGTLTPLSNNAEIVSYPYICQINVTDPKEYPQWDQYAAQIDQNALVDIPTAVGFCMFISRRCLEQTGYFDDTKFGKGYGEENDFSMRASSLGFRNCLLPSVFVRHIGGISFADTKKKAIQRAAKIIAKDYPDYHHIIQQFIKADPIKPYRQILDALRLKDAENRPAILLIIHEWGGGTEHHIRDLAQRLESEGMCAYTLRPFKGQYMILGGVNHALYPNLTFLPSEINQLKETLDFLSIAAIHVHQKIGFMEGFDTLILQLKNDLSLPLYATLHDYYSICPRLHLIDKSGVYCGEPEDSNICNSCLSKNGSSVKDISDITRWRQDQFQWYHKMDAIYAPSVDTKNRIQHYFPDLDITVIPHPEDPTPLIPRPISSSHEVRHIILLGALADYKGASVVKSLIEDAKKRNLPLHFTIIGYMSEHHAIADYDNVTITGPYKEQDLPDLLQTAQGQIALFTSLCPETYSYTLSTAIKSYLIPVAFDLGAFSERIAMLGYGTLLPFTMYNKASDINDVLCAIDITSPNPNLNKTFIQANIIENYYPALHHEGEIV